MKEENKMHNKPDEREMLALLSFDHEAYIRRWNQFAEEYHRERRAAFWRNARDKIIIYFCVFCAATPFFLLWAALLRWVILQIPEV